MNPLKSLWYTEIEEAKWTKILIRKPSQVWTFIKFRRVRNKVQELISLFLFYLSTYIPTFKSNLALLSCKQQGLNNSTVYLGRVLKRYCLIACQKLPSLRVWCMWCRSPDEPDSGTAFGFKLESHLEITSCIKLIRHNWVELNSGITQRLGFCLARNWWGPSP